MVTNKNNNTKNMLVKSFFFTSCCWFSGAGCMNIQKQYKQHLYEASTLQGNGDYLEESASSIKPDAHVKLYKNRGKKEEARLDALLRSLERDANVALGGYEEKELSPTKALEAFYNISGRTDLKSQEKYDIAENLLKYAPLYAQYKSLMLKQGPLDDDQSEEIRAIDDLIYAYKYWHKRK